MAGIHEVTIRIVSIAGKCPNDHRVGEEYRVGGKTPAGICLSSFSACLPYLIALQSGASFSWGEQEGTATIGCPDPVNRVVWRLERGRGSP